MAEFNHIPMQGRAGQGATVAKPFPAGLETVLIPLYRAFTHKISKISIIVPLRTRFFLRDIKALRFPRSSFAAPRRGENSTHSCPYIYTFRDSTHLSTVKPPTLSHPRGASSVGTRHGHLANPSANTPIPHLATVLRPTFSPFFESHPCRASNHASTVTLPIKQTRTTVPPPTKTSTNYLKQLQSLQRKDVFKICIKKTSGLMMFFFLLDFFSSNREASTK